MNKLLISVMNTLIERPLSIKERRKLRCVMCDRNITQHLISLKSTLTAVQVYRICQGKYNITEHIIKQFLKAGINLKDIMNE